MRRPVCRPWAFVVGLLACYVLSGVMFFLAFGTSFPSGILEPTLEFLWKSLSVVMGGEAARYVLIAALATVPFAGGLGVHMWLRGGVRRDTEFLRCLKCGHILKGLTEPRCPECGERI